MSFLAKTCMRTAAVLAVVAAATACTKKDEYGGGSGGASPGAGAYASPQSGPYGSPGTAGGMASPRTMGPGLVMAQVRAIDAQAGTITVTDSAAMSPRTLPVETTARAELAGIKVGDQVTITCGTGAGTGATGTGTMGTASPGAGSTAGSLSECATVASITPESGSSRGR